MMGNFVNLAEFKVLRDEEKIDFEAMNLVLDGLNFKNLNLTLSRLLFFRVIGTQWWIKALSKEIKHPISICTVGDEIVPYMQEDGIICFCKKDFTRKDKLFMLLAHESSHFILMQDKNYELIKSVDCEYRRVFGCDEKMNSPIEHCANIITLMILRRCKLVEKKQKKAKKIEICIKSLEKQLT